MALRKGKCYRNLTRPYTRISRFKRESFIATVPALKTTKYEFGDKKRKFPVIVKLVSKIDHNIRDNSLESIRMVINRTLQRYLGPNYFFKINVFPHHILRENKMLTGAGADRMQTGMAHSFGKPVGRAARVKKGTIVALARVEEQGVKIVQDAYRKAIPRLPGKYGIEIEKIAS